jgi:hypothetical protein
MSKPMDKHAKIYVAGHGAFDVAGTMRKPE